MRGERSGPGWRARLLAVVSISPGEERRALLVFSYLFLVIAAYLLIKTIRNALFISAYGAMKLPYVMLGVAVLAAGVAAVYIRLARRYPTARLVYYSLLFFAANIVVFWWLALAGRPWLYPVLYIWAGVFGVIAPTQVWTLANELFTTRQAKRLFGFIGAGGILGGFVGGAVANRLATVIGTPQLLLAVVALLGLAALVVRRLSHESPPVAEVVYELRRPDSLRESAGVILSSKHLRLLAALVFVSAIGTTSIEFQFSVVAAEHIQDRDRLAAFFGAVSATVALLSFAMQLLLTSRLLASIGVGAVLLVLPLSLASGSVALLVTGSLWAGVMLKGSDQTLKHALDRACRELLYLPVPPSVKLHAKSTIDTVMDRLGDGMAGVLQIVITGLLGWGLRGSLATNIVLLGIWLLLAIRLRGAYVHQLLQSLGRPRRSLLDAPVEPDADARRALESVLASGREREKLDALEWIGAAGIAVDDKVLVETAGRDPSPRVRRTAVAVLLARDGIRPPEELLSEFEVEERSVLVALIDLLVDDDPASARVRVESLLARGGDSTRLSVAALTLRRLGPDMQPMAERVFDALLESGAPAGGRRSAVAALGLLPPESPLVARIVPLLEDPDPDVAAAAAEAAERLGRPEFAPGLVALLARPGCGGAARRALVAIGPPALAALAAAIGPAGAPRAVRRRLPRLLAEIGGLDAVETLVAVKDDADPRVAEAAVKALHRLRQHVRELRPIGRERLVRDILEQVDRYELLTAAAETVEGAALEPAEAARWLLGNLAEARVRTLERIFNLLALEYPPVEMSRSWATLRGDGGAVERANAVELLDNLLPGVLKHRVVPLLERYGQGASPAGSAGRREPMTVEAALRELAGAGDPWLAACALHLARRARVPGCDGQARRGAASEDPALRDEALAYVAALEAGGVA